MRIRWFLTGGIGIFLLILSLTEDLPFAVHIARSVVKLFARRSQQVGEMIREEARDRKVAEAISSRDSTHSAVERRKDLNSEAPMPSLVPRDSTRAQPGTPNHLDSLFRSVGAFKEELWERIAPSKRALLPSKEPKPISKPTPSRQEPVDRVAVIDLLDRTDALYDSLLRRNP